ncbi:putative chaperone protein [Aliiruegeria haliotis]|uniref:Putative chaperone protein n=1 Tax=Aliiruegeria haliotis TaxID=1280846 RepID=A0A2T0RND2_9RHOB|nr:Hsp70 family protein [Aliiruegeria haliotis]PRY22695.1 putative chaperone protein [Aliiruegeria haliotis]
MSHPVLAVDFGTSNSAAAVLDGSTVWRIPVEAGADTLPTAVFFPADSGQMRIGSAAGAALVAGEEGRYMRALKSILGTSLFHELRLIEGRRRKLADIVTAFLVQVRERAEAETGVPLTRVLSGRPVRFHSTDDARDAQAETDLRGCYAAAGFEEVDFLYEPEAAARASLGLGEAGETGLIVDIGGGTSDFSVFRQSTGGIEILASHGIRLGGTDFDTEVSMAHAMPLLGHGGQLRRTFGNGLLPVPIAIYRELATWAKIAFLYARDTERHVDDLLAHAVEPEKLKRLHDVVHEQLGHDLAFAVEAGKIAANSAAGRDEIGLGFIERGLSAPITPGSLNAALADFAAPLRGAVWETLRRAGTPPADIGSVILVGGSSLMTLVSDLAAGICPSATLRHSEAFTAVVDGLALATGES